MVLLGVRGLKYWLKHFLHTCTCISLETEKHSLGELEKAVEIYRYLWFALLCRNSHSPVFQPVLTWALQYLPSLPSRNVPKCLFQGIDLWWLVLFCLSLSLCVQISTLGSFQRVQWPFHTQCHSSPEIGKKRKVKMHCIVTVNQNLPGLNLNNVFCSDSFG